MDERQRQLGRILSISSEMMPPTDRRWLINELTVCLVNRDETAKFAERLPAANETPGLPPGRVSSVIRTGLNVLADGELLALLRDRDQLTRLGATIRARIGIEPTADCWWKAGAAEGRRYAEEKGVNVGRLIDSIKQEWDD